MRSSSLRGMSETLTGRLLSSREANGALDEVGDTRSSTMVFHCPHWEHRPSHLGDSAPHSVQNHAVLIFFAIALQR